MARPPAEADQRAGERARRRRRRSRRRTRRASRRSPRRRSGRARSSGAYPSGTASENTTTVTHSHGARAHLAEALARARPARCRRSLGGGGASAACGRARAAGRSRRRWRRRAGTPSRRRRRARARWRSPGRSSSARLKREARQGLGVLDLVGRHRARHEARVGRLENACAVPKQRLDHDDLPDLHRVREDERRRAACGAHARATSVAIISARARQAVRPDAADQEEGDQRQHVRRQHDAHLGGVVREVGDEQRDGDDHDAVAERAGASGRARGCGNRGGGGRAGAPSSAERLPTGAGYAGPPRHGPSCRSRRNTALLSAVARRELGHAPAAGRRGLDHACRRCSGIDGLLGLGPAIVLACGALAAPFAGRAMDRIGRVPVLAAGFAIGAVGGVVAAVGSRSRERRARVRAPSS